MKLKTQYGQERYNKENSLTESPDNVNKYNLSFTDSDSLAFGYYKGVMYVNKRFHGDHPDIQEMNLIRSDFKYPGRVWLKSKIISFWKYPTEKEFHDVILDIENNSEMFFDDVWKVEVVDDSSGTKESYFVGLDEFEGSPDWSIEEFKSDHEKSPLIKKKEKPTYFKNIPLAWRQAKMKSESLLDLMTDISDDDMENNIKDLSIMDKFLTSARNGYFKGVESAIDTGIDINIFGGQALYHAVIKGFTDIVKLLIDKGAKITSKVGLGLSDAVDAGYIDIVKLLIANDADININNDYALSRAAANGNAEIVQLLIDNGADVNTGKGFPLKMAKEYNHPEVIKTLLNNGAIDITNESLLDKMTDVSDEEIEKQLKNLSPEESYLISAENGYVKGIQRALDQGVSIDCMDFRALKYAAEDGFIDVIQTLIDNGANISYDTDYALRAASGNGHDDVVTFLLDHGADIHAYNDESVRYAASRGLTSTVKLLLDNGADIHARSDEALRYATKGGYADTVQLLLDRGANARAMNYDALETSIDEGFPEITKMIRKHLGIKESSKNNMKKLDNFNKFNVSLHLNENKEDMINERVSAKMKLPQDVIDFQKLFEKKGYKLYVVGGAVRDFLMGKKPHDFDMVTDTTPENVMDALKDYRTDLQGVHFGVVRVFTDSEPEGYEIASYRKDISKGRDTKGDDAKVEIGKHITIKDDVKRRDLTMNALFYNIKTGEIVDVVGGISDIENKIVRAVGNPRKRFDEDRLRILRALRFAAITDSKLDKGTRNAIKRDSRLFDISDVDDVSRERIFLEFKKVKEKARKNDDPKIIKRFVDDLIEFGIMEQIFPVITKHKTIRPTTYLTVAIAQVLRDNEITQGFKDILTDARIPGDFIEIISILIKMWRMGSIAPEDVYELYKEVRNKSVRRDILEEWYKVMNITDKSYMTFLDYVPSTSGNDVMKDGFKGASIGNEIRKREGEKFKKMLNESIIRSFDKFKNDSN